MMDNLYLYILIGITIILLALIIYLIHLIKNPKNSEEIENLKNDLKVELAKEAGGLKEHLAKENAETSLKLQGNYQNFEKNLTTDLNSLKESLKDSINHSREVELKNNTEFLKSIHLYLEQGLEKINQKVDERLNVGFAKTKETFEGLLERITKIDEAQKKLDELSTNIVSLESVLSDKKSRGCYGEIQLHTLLASIFGDKNDKIYRLQYKLSNGLIADAVLNCPSPVGLLCIDSKFPLENYRRMVDKTLSEAERLNYEKAFKNDCKKHIDDISNKYILPGETSDQAILFLPAEAIFAEINAHLLDVVEYANSKRVWITSPTTLMATLTTLQILLRNMERDKHAKEIQEELVKLAVEFDRYKERWDKLLRSLDTVSSDAKNIHTTTQKISKRFDSISKVEIEDTDNFKEVE